MGDSESTTDIKPGDFVYQSDQELFLVATSVNEDSIRFAVHGWREIDHERLEEYLDEDGLLYEQETVVKAVEEEKGEDTQEHFEELLALFSAYEDALPEEGAHTRFDLTDSESTD